MANRQIRNPGELLRLEAEGRISQNVPSAAVYSGQAWEALAQTAGGLSARLGKLADDAAAREGQLAGLTAGQQSGAAYLQAKATAHDAATVAGDPNERARAAQSYLMNKHGLEDWRAAAIVGHGMQESRFDTGAIGDQGTAFGSFQWRGARRTGLEAFARQTGRAASDLETQLDYVMHELNGSEKSAGAAFFAAKDLTGAVDAFMGFERPAGWTAANPRAGHGYANRMAFAKGVLGNAGPTAPKGAEKFQSETLSTQPLALRRDGTIAGEAFDKAAASAYAWRMQEGLSSDLTAAHEQFADDPQGFAGALADVRAKYAADPNLADPFLREAFDKEFTQRSEAYVRDVSARRERKIREEQLVSFSDGLVAAQVDIERQAQVLGANPDGDRILFDQVTKLGTAIDGAVETGTITPAQAAKYKDELALTAARGRVQGVFDALPTAEAKEQYSLALLDDWKTGKGPLAKLPFAQVRAMSDTLRRDAREQINQRMAANKAEAAKIATLMDDDVLSVQTSGKGLDPASGLTPERVLELTGQEGLDRWQAARDKAGRIHDASNGMERQSAADIAERLEVMKPQPGTVGYAEDLEIYENAVKRAQDVVKERQVDPLGQAARSGAITLEPIDATSPERLDETLAARKAAQVAVTGMYGQPVPVFRPGEKEQLAAALIASPESLAAFSFSVRSVYGNDTPRVLAEIAPDAPIIAHVAGLAYAGGDNSVASDVANTLALKREKIFTLKMPGEDKLARRAAMELDGAFSADPRTAGAVVQTANVLFEQMANTQGFDPADVDKEGTVAARAYARALDRAAGGRTIGDVAYGGLAEVNGQTIIVPADMPKDEPQRLLSSLTAEQLAMLPPIASGDFPIDPADLRGASLVSAGDGLYRVALGDPLGDDPRYLAAPDGRYWTLDIRQLGRVAETAPAPRGWGGMNPFGWQAPK